MLLGARGSSGSRGLFRTKIGARDAKSFEIYGFVHISPCIFLQNIKYFSISYSLGEMLCFLPNADKQTLGTL
jgi:hypothetical protein